MVFLMRSRSKYNPLTIDKKKCQKRNVPLDFNLHSHFQIFWFPGPAATAWRELQYHVRKEPLMVTFSAKGELDLEKATNSTARGYWEKKKTKLLWRTSVFFVILAYVGLEFCAPGISLTGSLQKNVILHSELLSEIFDQFPKYGSSGLCVLRG